MCVTQKKRSRRVRFIVAWQTYKVGDEIEPPGMKRDWLINAGYCEPVKPVAVEPEQGFETATVDPVTETTAKRSSRSKQSRVAGKGRRHNDAVRA